jgi:hypothetical protein
MRHLLVVAAVALMEAACGSANPLVPDSTTDLAGGTFAISGTITESTEEGDRPAGDALVDASRGNDSRTTRSDELGHYVLKRLPAGVWTITVVKAGFTTAVARVRVTGDATADFALDRSEGRQRNPHEPFRRPAITPPACPVSVGCVTLDPIAR